MHMYMNFDAYHKRSLCCHLQTFTILIAAISMEPYCRELLRRCDPAALVPEPVSTSLASALDAEMGQHLPIFGREVDFRELLPLHENCHACGSVLSRCTSKASASVIVHTTGLVRKQHVPLRCRKPACSAAGMLHWNNYVAGSGKHVFLGKPGQLRCFMLSSSFGFSVAWLKQFHLRMVRQHATFLGESEVLYALARDTGGERFLPARLRLLISEAWTKWRLLVRASSCGIHDVFPCDLNEKTEQLLAQHWPAFQEAFSKTAVGAARAAHMRTDVVVLDGNAKNRRAVCASLLSGSTYSPTLMKTLRHSCTGTPALGKLFCCKHTSAADSVLAEDWFSYCWPLAIFWKVTFSRV